MEQVGELTRRGLAAVTRLARRIGLPADEPMVLSHRGNLLVHLTPAPVVARVATLTGTGRLDPMAWLAREVAVAGYVAERGGPVVPPAAEAGPYWQAGLAISLWQHVVARDEEPRPADVGAVLGRLHLAARDCPADIGELHAATTVLRRCAYAAETRTEVPTAARLGPFRRVRDIEAAVWALGVAQSYPARYRGTAHAAAGNRARRVTRFLVAYVPGPTAWSAGGQRSRRSPVAAAGLACRRDCQWVLP